MKGIRNIAIILLSAVALWWVLRKLDVLPHLSRIFARKEVVIDQTPLVIRQVKALAQLSTVTAYTEVIADTTAPTSTGERLRDVFNPFTLQVHTTRKLVITGGVVVHAGVDLNGLSPQDIFIRGDSLSLKLPPAKLLDVILNPSNTEIFLEEGSWENAAVVALKTRLQTKAVAQMNQRGILYQADERAKEVLTNFFLAAGFRKVNIVPGRLQ